MMAERGISGLALVLVAACGSPGTAAVPEEEAAGPFTVDEEETAAPSAQEPVERTLAIQPLGDIDDEALETVRTSIETIFAWDVVMMERAKHPESAWYKPRKRYRAEIILEWLGPRLPEEADRIMAVTRKDISTTKGAIHDWGICGLADLDGPTSLVSTYRIKKKMGKLGPKERKKKYLTRLRDLSAHEFGHSLGLPHCPTKGCIMEDAKGTVLTFDHSNGRLCDACTARLEKSGFPVPSH